MTPLTLTMTNVIGSWQPQQLDVFLQWRPAFKAELDHYTLYQATKDGQSSGPWQEVARVHSAFNAHTRTIPDDKNFTWYVTASDADGNETQASNTVDLYKSPPKGIVSNPGRLPT